MKRQIKTGQRQRSFKELQIHVLRALDRNASGLVRLGAGAHN